MTDAASAIASVIASVKQGNTVHFYTDGAWSLYQLVTALTEVSGDCIMYTSTYSMSETSARAMQKLKAEKVIREIHCLIDNRSESRSAESMQLLHSVADTCTLLPCHAKVTVLLGKEVSVCVLSSANWTENKRMECGIVTTDPTACAFHMQWMTDKSKEHE